MAMVTCVRRASLVGVMFVLALPAALHAVALPPVSRVLLVDGGTPGGPTIPVDGVLLFTYECRACPVGPDSPLPGVVVTATDGMVQSGSLVVVHPGGVGVPAIPYLRWVPESPLPEGSYQVAISQGSMPADWAGDTSSTPSTPTASSTAPA
jgi:hypothetical protein